ncbi:uncharacterized protein C8Q71DRAFT_898820 [Rhodofomes roseus]|uniref:Uncharacterized protein n=1 Tax=Rhodofomes roseus TaxID=34475 RepID=A0ABQ8KJC1_9APHY|nr:uncharacterized protein C8Q71DRAFT_898820 [Rhodofomes roseus]KAH9837941.1 hypothetical protein C8Q71DRAFT_898820 [Rhodofomes roseus]
MQTQPTNMNTSNQGKCPARKHSRQACRDYGRGNEQAGGCAALFSAMYAQASPPASAPYLPQPLPQQPYASYNRFDTVLRPSSGPSGSPSCPPRGSPRPLAAQEQSYDNYAYDNGSSTPPDPDGDDFYASQTDFRDQHANTAPSIATQSIWVPSPPLSPVLDQSHLRPGNQAALLS